MNLDDRAQTCGGPSVVLGILIAVMVGIHVTAAVLTPAQLDTVATVASTVATWVAISTAGGLISQYAVRADFGERLVLDGP